MGSPQFWKIHFDISRDGVDGVGRNWTIDSENPNNTTCVCINVSEPSASAGIDAS